MSDPELPLSVLKEGKKYKRRGAVIPPKNTWVSKPNFNNIQIINVNPLEIVLELIIIKMIVSARK